VGKTLGNFCPPCIRPKTFCSTAVDPRVTKHLLEPSRAARTISTSGCSYFIADFTSRCPMTFMYRLQIAGLLHDSGTIVVPTRWRSMRTHSYRGGRALDRLVAHLHGSGRCLRSDPIRVPEATRSTTGSRASGLLCRALRHATCRVQPASIRRPRLIAKLLSKSRWRKLSRNTLASGYPSMSGARVESSSCPRTRFVILQD
jgi:hypothetical protein